MLYLVKNRIKFNITQEDGRYTAVASGKNYSIITDGKNFEDLKRNIQEAVSVHLADDTGLSKDSPRKVLLSANFEIPLSANFEIPFSA